MYVILGWTNVIVLGVLLTPSVINFLNRNFLKMRFLTLTKITKPLKTLHNPLGLIILILPLIHGYLAMGTIRIHTGSLLYTFILLTAILGGSFYRLKERNLFIWHKIMAFVSFLLFLLHLFFPKAIYYLLR